MEYEKKTTHSSPATCTSLEPNSDSGDDPPPPTTANGEEEPKEENPESAMETKRRKICPSALDKCEAIIVKSCSNSTNCFSFSFDPKFSSGASTPEVTPKFGSFNLVAEASESAEIEEKSLGKNEEEEKDDDHDEVQEKRKIDGVLGSVDGLSED